MEKATTEQQQKKQRGERRIQSWKNSVIDILHDDGEKTQRRNAMKTKTTAMVLLILFGLGVAMCNATTITPPTKIELDGGSEANGIWKGGYWTFTCSVDQADSMVGSVILPTNTTKGYDNGTEIRTKKSVEIRLTPHRAYYKRTLKLMEISDRIVLPKTYGGGLNWAGFVGPDKDVSIEPVVVNTYAWSEDGWQKYTVFNATVLVDGQVVGQASLNTEKGTKNLVVPTVNGSVLIKNLGRLEGDYTEPQTDEIVIFDKKYIYGIDALNYIRYDHGRTFKPFLADNSLVGFVEDTEAFSTYWFGNARWNPPSIPETFLHYTPAPYKDDGNAVVIADPNRGWKQQDYFGGWGRVPVSPDIFPGNGDSLIEYLNRKTAYGNLAKNFLAGYEWDFEYQDGNPSAVVVELPWGAYSGAPVVSCYVPTELADTWIYRPPISNVRIIDAGWTNGSEITDYANCTLVLWQNSTVLSSATILADTEYRASVEPKSVTVTMTPNETKTVTFTVRNLGVTNDTVGTVSFRVLRTWDGLQTDSMSLKYTLKKPVMPDNITDVIDRPEDAGKTVPPVPEYSIPWLMIVGMICATVVAVTIITVVYKSKAIKKKGVQSILTTFGNLGKAGAKEGLKIGKSLWKSSPTIRAMIGVAVGVGMIWLGAQPIPALLGAISFGFFSVSLLSAALIGLGLFVIAVCAVRIFK